MNTKAPAHIVRFIKSWNMIANLLRFCHVLLGVVGVACPLVVAAFLDVLSPGTAKALSCISAVAIGFFAAFNIGEQANKFRSAWRMLNIAVFQFEVGTITEKDLVAVYAESENLIGTVKANPFSANDRPATEPH